MKISERLPESGNADSEIYYRDSQSSRDESAYYQAETQTLTRENQMLRMRIRELGKSELKSHSSLEDSRLITTLCRTSTE